MAYEHITNILSSLGEGLGYFIVAVTDSILWIMFALSFGAVVVSLVYAVTYHIKVKAYGRE